MKDLLGSPGTVTGLLLRFGQSLFAASSIGVMVSALGFANFTAYCYLIASMGLQVLWSFGLACLDIYALWIKRDLRNPVLVSLFVVGDWIVIHISFIQRMRFGISRTVTLYQSAISETKLPCYSSRYFIYEDITLVASACSGRTIYIAVGLWLTVTATLSLAAACSSAGIAVLYAKDLKFCTGPSHLPCDRFELSIALAFVTWSLIAISSHVMFWVLASV